MKMAVVTIFLLLFSFLIYPDRSMAGWIDIGHSVFFDPSNIEYTYHGTILVWFNEKLERGAIIDRLIQHDNYYDKDFNYADYSYSIEQYEYDCTNKLMRLTIEYDYADNNRVIFRTFGFKSQYEPADLTHESKRRFNEVCSFAIENKSTFSIFQQHHHSLPQVINPRLYNK